MDAKAVARGILEGIESSPNGIAYSARRTWQGAGLEGGEFKRRNEIETERFIKVIRAVYGIEAPLRELITVIRTTDLPCLPAESSDVPSDGIMLQAGHH
ncbi:hypothetical protein SPRA44_670027 [Serratia proteamaculans]|nr:hypothetical protein SPRA44_670027 [Serratia proteamaculans]